MELTIANNPKEAVKNMKTVKKCWNLEKVAAPNKKIAFNIKYTGNASGICRHCIEKYSWEYSGYRILKIKIAPTSNIMNIKVYTIRNPTEVSNRKDKNFSRADAGNVK